MFLTLIIYGCIYIYDIDVNNSVIDYSESNQELDNISERNNSYVNNSAYTDSLYPKIPNDIFQQNENIVDDSVPSCIIFYIIQ